MNVPAPVYGDVPPVAATVTVDEPPLQIIAVADEEAAKTAVCVIVTCAVAVQKPFAFPFAAVAVIT